MEANLLKELYYWNYDNSICHVDGVGGVVWCGMVWYGVVRAWCVRGACVVRAWCVRGACVVRMRSDACVGCACVRRLA